MENRGRNSGSNDRFYFLGLEITVDSNCGHEIKKMLAPWKKSYDKPRQHIKKQIHHFANKGPYSQSYGFPVVMLQIWELDHREGWVLKHWCFRIVVLDGGGNGNPLQYSGLRNPLDRGAQLATVHGVHGVTKSHTWLSNLACARVHTHTDTHTNHHSRREIEHSRWTWRLAH